MHNLKLVFPDESYKEQTESYKQEFLEEGEALINGASGLELAESFEAWVQSLKNNLCEETVQKGYVPGTTFLAVTEENKLVGTINIRHRLNDFLLNFGGHIGYSIRKSERQKGYGGEMLRLALEFAKSLNMDKVLITCNKENTASAKTILHNGGILEDERENDGHTVQRYWIDLV
ncbi:MAG: GNAT family N-acetyltransferase [Oscillospiraceae bacterium]